MCSISIRWKWISPFLILFLFTLSASAQITQSARLELPIESGISNPLYKVISAKEQGLIILRHLTGQRKFIEIIRADTALNEIWRGGITLEENLTLLHTQVDSTTISLLLKGANYTSGDFIIINVRLDDGKYMVYRVRNLIPFNPTNYILTPYAALIGGYFNYRPVVLYYNFTQQQSKILPGFFNEPGELNQMQSSADGSIDIVVSARNFERKKCLWIRNYDNQGNLTKTIVLTPQDKKNLIFGRSVQSANGEQIVSGVYGRYADYSRGVFVAVINAMGEYTIRYYSYAELQHFFKYMKAKREKRVLNRIERRKVKGKKTKFNYRLLIHDLIPYNNQFVMLGEAFYPHYSYASRTYNSFTYSPRFYSNPLAREGLIFDGYQYTHAVVIGFDQTGKLLWDNSFEVNDVRTMELERFVKIQAERDRIILLYLYQNTLRSKIIKNDEVLEGKNTEDLEAKFESDEVNSKDTEMSKLEHWYGNYFFAYGAQTVINTREFGVSRKRKVFFINKITYK